MTNPVIQIRDLQYRYRGQKENALQDISLDVDKGEFLAIMGPSEAGKSILVMDEPTTDLDPLSKLGIFEISERLRKRDDITMVVVEHETEEIIQADRLVLLRDGKVVRIGKARELLTDVELLEGLGVMPL